MGMVAILIMFELFETNLCSSSNLQRLHKKFHFNWPSSSEEKL